MVTTWYDVHYRCQMQALTFHYYVFDCSRELINFMRKLMILHPDRKGCTNNEVKRRSDAFIQLTEAYEILKVPERRRSYDISLDENGTFANCTKGPDVDGLFTGFQHASKESPSSIAEMYYGFWQNFGVFGDCLRFIAQSMIVAVVAVGALIRFSK
uniref:J domain-containing protein n=1 Tax=Setaria digitata TaxID=48799 RepID=A0A915PVR4_9BILA